MAAVHGAGRRGGARRSLPRAGRPGQPRASCTRFLSDTVLLTGEGFAPPPSMPELGRARARPRVDEDAADRRRALLPGPRSSRATPPSSRRCATAIEDAGGQRPAGVLRFAARRRRRRCCDDAARRPTRWSPPCSPRAARTPASASAGGDDEAWDVGRARRAGRPGPAGALPDHRREARGRPATTALSPMDAATQVAIPEFDGRLITVPFSFKEIDADGAPGLRRRPRAGRPRRRHRRARTPGCGTCRTREQASSRCASPPTRPSTPGSATRSAWTRPASAVALLRRAARGRLRHRRRAELPRRRRAGRRRADPRADRGRRPRRGVADRGAAGRQPGRGSPLADYRRWFDTLPGDLRDGDAWSTGASRRASCTSTRRTTSCSPRCGAGNVVLMIQPPRGFGENPIAIYHDPDLPPSPPLPGAPTAGWRAGQAASAPTRSCTWASTAPWSGCRARALGLSRGLRPGRRARRPAAGLPVHRQRPGRGHPGQAPRRTPRSSTTWCRRWPAPRPTATSPGWSSCSTSTPTSPATGPGEAARRSARRSGR